MDCDNLMIRLEKCHYVIRYLKEPGLYLYVVRCFSDGVKFTERLDEALMFYKSVNAQDYLDGCSEILPDNCEIVSVFEARKVG